MTYQELKERVYQQGNQCGVNLMSSAVLRVEAPMVQMRDDSLYIAQIAVTNAAFAFGFSKEDVDEDGVIYRDTFTSFVKLLAELDVKNELPIIRARVFGDFTVPFSEGSTATAHYQVTTVCEIKYYRVVNIDIEEIAQHSESTDLFMLIPGIDNFVISESDFEPRPTE